uniref:Uncharacterized protein n=1 Tax=Plectus sambesii TaxID=2011161 RepID=A0A914WBB4_9BILA
MVVVLLFDGAARRRPQQAATSDMHPLPPSQPALGRSSFVGRCSQRRLLDGVDVCGFFVRPSLSHTPPTVYSSPPRCSRPSTPRLPSTTATRRPPASFALSGTRRGQVYANRPCRE